MRACTAVRERHDQGVRTTVIVAAVVTVAAAMVLLTLAARDGDDDLAAGEPREVTVAQVLADVAGWSDVPLRITGVAVPAGDGGFLLQGARRAIAVRPEPGAVDLGDLAPGVRVEVRGRVRADGREPFIAAAAVEPLPS
jgi:hypothetical protein